MRYSRLDLSIIDRLISLLGQSKINKSKASTGILRKLNHIYPDNTNEYSEIVDLYIDHLNSDVITNFGRRAHIFLSSISLNEGVNFSNIAIKDSADIVDPLFVIGLPRSGTTNLHNMLIDNLNYSGLKYWQLTSPNPIFNNNSLDTLARKTRSLLGFYLYRYLVPSIQSMHKVKMTTYEECWHFQKTMFLCYNYVIQLKFFEFGDELLDVDTSYIYKQYKRLIQQNTELDQTYALKCPDHMMSLNTIDKVFPESVIVWIHRDPYDSLVSYCSMVNSVWELFLGYTNKKEVGRFVLELFDKMIKRTIHHQSRNNEIINISYNQLISDRKKVINELSEKLDRKINISKQSTESNFFKNKYNKNKYDYGISRDEVYQRLSYYNDDFSDYLK